jgi:hypothetical protein
MNIRVMENSIDCLSRDINGHASVPYRSMGKHLARNKLKTTSSEAVRPTLLYNALKARKNLDLA